MLISIITLICTISWEKLENAITFDIILNLESYFCVYIHVFHPVDSNKSVLNTPDLSN